MTCCDREQEQDMALSGNIFWRVGMLDGTQQKREIESIKDRELTIRLSDADCERLAKKVGLVNLSIPELVENFIGDLIDGTYSNGSDERRLANEWFERCGFGMFPKQTLLRYLREYGYDVEDFLIAYDEMKYYEEDPERYVSYLKENNVPMSEPMWFYEDYERYTSDYIRECGDSVDMEEEVERCRKWLYELQLMLDPKRREQKR